MISFPQSNSGCTTIQQWEAAGASLAAALANYANACLSLSMDFDQKDNHAEKLAIQIDSALEAHSAIGLQLARSGASLSRMRNQVRTSLHRIPEEVLSEIFRHVVFDALGHRFTYRFSSGTPTEQTLWQIYRRRQGLLGVCSVWRKVITTSKSFWSIIPITTCAIQDQALETCLQRAGGHPLHVVVTTEETISDQVVDALSRCVSQIRSLVIQSRPGSIFRRLIKLFLAKGTPHSLSELSLRRTPPNLEPYDESEYIFERDTPNESLPANFLIESLSCLRVSGIYSYWDPARARNLVELQLHQLQFEDNTQMLACLRSVSSAPQLRDLKIISAHCFRIQRDHTGIFRTISFPELQFLTLSGLYISELRIILRSIYRGSHHLTLCLTEEISSDQDLHGDQIHDSNIGELIKILNRAEVNSLLLGTDCESMLLESSFYDLLGSLKELKTLKISGWGDTTSLWDILISLGHPPGETPNNPNFPRIQNLHVTGAEINDERGLKEVVRHHQVQRLELGACRRRYTGCSPFDDFEGPGDQPLSDELLSWLSSEVSQFTLVDSTYYPPEFDDSCWELY